MDLLTLTEIRRAAQNGSVLARVHVQVDASTAKSTREGKPYCELGLAAAPAPQNSARRPKRQRAGARPRASGCEHSEIDAGRQAILRAGPRRRLRPHDAPGLE